MISSLRILSIKFEADQWRTNNGKVMRFHGLHQLNLWTWKILHLDDVTPMFQLKELIELEIFPRSELWPLLITAEDFGSLLCQATRLRVLRFVLGRAIAGGLQTLDFLIACAKFGRSLRELQIPLVVNSATATDKGDWHVSGMTPFEKLEYLSLPNRRQIGFLDHRSARCYPSNALLLPN